MTELSILSSHIFIAIGGVGWLKVELKRISKIHGKSTLRLENVWRLLLLRQGPFCLDTARSPPGDL